MSDAASIVAEYVEKGDRSLLRFQRTLRAIPLTTSARVRQKLMYTALNQSWSAWSASLIVAVARTGGLTAHAFTADGFSEYIRAIAMQTLRASEALQITQTMDSMMVSSEPARKRSAAKLEKLGERLEELADNLRKQVPGVREPPRKRRLFGSRPGGVAPPEYQPPKYEPAEYQEEERVRKIPQRKMEGLQEMWGEVLRDQDGDEMMLPLPAAAQRLPDRPYNNYARNQPPSEDMFRPKNQSKKFGRRGMTDAQRRAAGERGQARRDYNAARNQRVGRGGPRTGTSPMANFSEQQKAA
ncbi:MAG: hypothetical protein KUG81_02330, partial [Gammaproteobacteria bacterium]|nr:hypothetical protein [Gammaproteobacteria bacterium]